MWIKLYGAVVILLALTTWSYAQVVMQTTGHTVVRKDLAVNVTTNTTTSTVSSVLSGIKSVYGEVVCSSGACTQTQAVYGSATPTAENGILLCTLTLSGTPRAQDACAPFTAAFQYYYVVTTNTTGTAATGAIYALF